MLIRDRETSLCNICSALICQNQTSLRRKLNAAYVCRTARSAASTQVKVGENGKILANCWSKKARRMTGEMCIARVSLL